MARASLGSDRVHSGAAHWWTLIAALIWIALNGCAPPRPVRAITPAIGARQTGIASWYGHPYHGRATASGETYDMEGGTAAHRRYSFGTWLRVDNLDNGKRTEVRVNDRGPFVRGRIIDLSRAAARQIEMLGPGTAKVRLTVIGAPPLHRKTRTDSSPPEPADAPRTAPHPSLRWGVQVASFRDASLARTLAAHLEREGREIRTQEIGPWTRVIVSGREGSEEEARLLRSELSAEFPGATLFSTGYPEK